MRVNELFSPTLCFNGSIKKRDLVESPIKNVYKYYGKAKNTDILNFIDSYINYWSLCFKNESFNQTSQEFPLL